MAENRMFSELREYYILEKDLKEVLEFIEPDGDWELDDTEDADKGNLCTFSHRLFGLLLRNCTAVEFHLKKILRDEISKDLLQRPVNSRGEEKDENSWNMEDYFYVQSTKNLSIYSVEILSWRTRNNKIKPFEEWSTEEYEPIPWYSDYNKVKHNVQENLKLANLKNVRDSLAGLFVLLYIQHKHKVFDSYQRHEGPYNFTPDDHLYATGSLFAIKPSD